MGIEEHRDYEKIAAAVEFIRANFDKPIKLADIVHETDLSASRLGHLFTEVMQVSPVTFLMTVRIEHAKRLLSTTEYSCREIAQMTGHSSGSYFTRVFKRITGQSPSVFRHVNGR